MVESSPEGGWGWGGVGGRGEKIGYDLKII